MHMRMEAQVLAPGMQYRYDPGRSTQVTRILAEGMQGVVCGLEQKVKQLLAVAHDQAVKVMRQREHHVVVFAWYQLPHARFHPLLLARTAAVRTMPVAAAVVLHLLCSASGSVAGIQVVTKGCGAATFYGSKCGMCPFRTLCTPLRQVLQQRLNTQRTHKTGVSIGPVSSSLRV